MIVRPVRLSDERGLLLASAGANLMLLIALVYAALGSPSVGLKAAAFATILVLAGLSGIRPSAFVRRIRFVLIFTVVLFVAQALSVHHGTAIVSSPIRITVEGLLSGAAMSLRFLCILSASMLFVWVTDPDRLAQTMIRFGVPYRFGYLLILALRFVPFFEAEVRTIREAQRVRGLETSVRSPRGVARAARYTFVPVLVSALSRVDGIAMSMKGRCFGLRPVRTFSRPLTWTLVDWAVLALSMVVCAATVLSRFRGWW